jgi:hypothetical protein
MSDDTDNTPDPTFQLVVGVNTYVDTDDAYPYFSTRPRSSAWTSASETDQENVLRQATTLIDTLDFHGRKATNAQALAWPRVNVRDRDGCAIPSDTVPQAVIKATCEWALYLLTNDPSKPTQVLTHKQVGDLQLDFAPMLPDTLPPLVRRYLQPYLRVSSPNVAAIIP